MTEPTSMPSQIRAGTPLAYLAVGLGLAAATAGLSSPTAGASIAGVLLKLLTAAWPAAVYLAGAVGLGRVARPLYAGVRDEGLVQGGVGLALMLVLSHVLGQAGLVGGNLGLAAAWTPVALGLGLLGQQAVAWSKRRLEAEGAGGAPVRRWGLIEWLPVMVATGVMVVAACNPPGGRSGQDFGGLWGSEVGGFDALSYHLPLPNEWLAQGRLAPLEHNVYSYLPGYVEAAFLHVAVLSGAGVVKGGLMADEGWRLITCQLLHAGLGVLTTIGVYRLVRAWAPADGAGARLAAGLAAATPWTVVVGSLAYNELAVTALSAPLLMAAWDEKLAPWRRGVLCGLLLAAASSVKAPAAFLLGAPAAVLVLGRVPVRCWPALAAGGAIAGLLAAAPWLVRNWQASGNPIFPFGTGLFGAGSWDEGQVRRWSLEHHESASFFGRVGMMFVRPAGGGQARGVLHPQWALFFPAVVVLGALAWRGAGRSLAVRLGAGLGLAVLLWLVLTHVQSRFLMPLLVPGAVLAGLGLASVGLHEGVKRAVGVLLAAGQAAATVVIFAAQMDGRPGEALAWMPEDAAGGSLRRAVANATSPERIKFFTQDAMPLQYVNLGLPPGSKVYLLGDARPLYYSVPIVYNTVWDRWPLLEAMRKFPGDPKEQGGLWIAELRRRGITHVLVNLGEVGRYAASGYSDPALTPEAVVETFIGRATLARAWGPADRPTILLFDISNAKSGLAWAGGPR